MNDYEYMSRDTAIAALTNAQIEIGLLNTKVAELEQAVKHWENSANDQLAARVAADESWAKRFERIKTELQAYADAGDLDIDESTLHQFLYDEFELDIFEEKQILLTITQGVSVKIRKGYDLSGYDFDLNVQVDSLVDEVEVEEYESPEVSDWEEM